MVIYSYPMEKKGKLRSPLVWFAKKEKSTGTLRCLSHASDPLGFGAWH